METITPKDFFKIVQECGLKCAILFLVHRLTRHECFINHIMEEGKEENK